MMSRKKEIEDQRAQLQAEAAGLEDGEYECWVKDDHGRETKIGGKHAKSWLTKIGVLEAEKPASETEEETEPQEEEKKPERKSYFR